IGTSPLNTILGVSVYRGRDLGRICAARVGSSQNCSPRTLIPIPVAPRITAPLIQPPRGVTSNILPSLSMTDLCGVSFETPAESRPSDDRLSYLDASSCALSLLTSLTSALQYFHSFNLES